MTLLFDKSRFCRTSILLWLFLIFAGQMLDPPLILPATAVALPPGATPPAASQNTPEVVVPTISNEEPGRMPLSEKQRRSVVKANFERMKHDAKELADLAKALQDDLAKSNENILSLDIVDKADKIEKLARKIKGTARGF